MTARVSCQPANQISVLCHVTNYQPITYQRHVEEDARGGGEDPGSDLGDLSQEEAGHHPDVGEDRGEEVVEDRLLHRHSCFE